MYECLIVVINEVLKEMFFSVYFEIVKYIFLYDSMLGFIVEFWESLGN